MMERRDKKMEKNMVATIDSLYGSSVLWQITLLSWRELTTSTLWRRAIVIVYAVTSSWNASSNEKTFLRERNVSSVLDA